ncbi:MAG TPA: undecaprenyl/decaprenyl-phosphate alpha-N-acetylglucosaminyl 1-phosphate transferase [Candidatus Hydrogenedentes bacterium]|nr:undecaprenyl/decaprenyl-phosphate alpha-N-acetylglucosaminyl 1-phosphate transferase [Candidatus Hydrogenedentota bacterium]
MFPFFQNWHYWQRTYLEAGITAFLVAVVTMPVAIVVLRRLGVVDKATADKLHRRPVVRGGGIVIFLAFAVGVLLPNYREHAMNGVMVGAFICMVVGAIDDFRGGMSATIKFITLVAVTLVMSSFGVKLNLFKAYPAVDLVLTVLWIVGVTSAFNALDNMDGLAGGLAAIVSAIYLVIAVQAFLAVGTETGLSWFGLLAAGLIGANLGFLIFNFKPARIFMGDSGSFFMGFTLAALGVMGEWTEAEAALGVMGKWTQRLISCTIPVLILGIPIFDFAYILIARILRGETRSLRQIIEHCALDHLSHRLTWIGFSQRQAVLFIYLAAAAMGITGILLRNSTDLIDSVLGLGQGFAIALIIVTLMAGAARRHKNVAAGQCEVTSDEAQRPVRPDAAKPKI